MSAPEESVARAGSRRYPRLAELTVRRVGEPPQERIIAGLVRVILARPETKPSEGKG